MLIFLQVYVPRNPSVRNGIYHMGYVRQVIQMAELV